MDKAMAVSDQILSLLHAILHTIRLNIFVITLKLFKALQNVLRDLRLGEFAHAMETVITQDWHDTGNNLTGYTSIAAISHPVVEYLIVKEELSDHKIGTCVNFLLQVANVVFPRSRLKMHFRVACHSDTEEITILLLDKPDQV